jgi:hypothetical protein
MRLEVTRYLWNGTTVPCNSTSSSASGTLTCDVGALEAQYQAQAYRRVTGENEVRLITLGYKVGEEFQTFGNEGLLWSFFLLMTMIVVGYWKPPIVVALYLGGLILLSFMHVIFINPAILIAQFAVGIAFIWAFRG